MVASQLSPRSHLDLEAMLRRRLEANQLRVPPYPAIAMRLQELAEADRCSTGELSRTISVDAALVAAVLRRTNAAAYGSALKITSVEVAVSRLGLQQLLQISLAQSVGTVANASGALSTLRRDVWRRSLLASRIAAELADSRGQDVDEAFLAGLLHDFGAITVLVGLEDLRVELPVLPAATWRIFVDKLQHHFGGVIAERWRLPEKITHAIMFCADPSTYGGPHRALVELVATTANVIGALDRAATTGVAALLELSSLSPDERSRIAALIPQIAELMDTFEPTAASEMKARTAVQPIAPSVDGGWPVDFLVRVKHDTYLACALGPNAIAMRGTVARSPNWLVPLVLDGAPVELDMLANIKTCVAQPDGGYLLVAQPFALGGKDKHLWLGLIQRTRPPCPHRDPALR